MPWVPVITAISNYFTHHDLALYRAQHPTLYIHYLINPLPN